MAWLVSEGQVLASADVATSRAERRRGLLGRDGVDGAVVLPHTRWVHTVGMRFAIDVAFLDAEGKVLRVTQMARHRIGRPERHADTVIEAGAGSFERWGLRVGSYVEIRP